MATAARAIADSSSRPFWLAAQGCGLLLTVALVAGLWLYPDPALRVLWYAVIPLLPAVFLVHPTVWRNVCPLATLNLLPGARSRGLPLDADIAKWAMVVGFALLVVLVPARRFLFNMDGRALAVVIVAVALLALVLGFVFDRKAGFCNSICPVLPVEKLYGQQPLAQVGNAHCATCSVCTARGCVDLAPHKAVPHALRRGRQQPGGWFLTPFGAFAAAFPGFVVAYYLIPDTTLAHAGAVYLKIAAGCVISYGAVVTLASALRAQPRHVLPLVGAVTLLLYYWFGAASIAAEWERGFAVVVAIRALSIALVTYWIAQRFVMAGAGRAPRDG